MSTQPSLNCLIYFYTRDIFTTDQIKWNLVSCVYFKSTDSPKAHFPITWCCRPHEICAQQQSGEAPQLFVGAQNRFDVNQGEIGDCWFLAPLSILAENKHFMDRVIPGGQGFEKNYADDLL